jgi:predicted ferric reductase
LTMVGRRLDRLDAHAGQFFLWRFLTRDRWWASHPFSLSRAPDGDSLRITVKDLGDFTGRIGSVGPGTRVVSEGPCGVFTDSTRRMRKALLIGGGIGITPIRSLLETMEGDLVVLYRVLDDDDVILESELRDIAERRDAVLHIVAGDHRTPQGRDLLSPDHLCTLVPDIRERDVYICGPPAMADVTLRSVRETAVPRRQIHTERFAL